MSTSSRVNENENNEGERRENLDFSDFEESQKQRQEGLEALLCPYEELLKHIKFPKFYVK